MTHVRVYTIISILYINLSSHLSPDYRNIASLYRYIALTKIVALTAVWCKKKPLLYYHFISLSSKFYIPVNFSDKIGTIVEDRRIFGLWPLKGQCHEIFDFWFFSWISFFQAPEYTNRVVLNFFEHSRRYSQLKVHHRCRWHRWQMAKIFRLKKVNYLVWTPLGSRVNIYINFWIQVQFKMPAAWYCTHYLPPVSLTPVATVDTGGNLPPASLTPVANLPQVSTTLAKLVAKICHRCRWYPRQFDNIFTRWNYFLWFFRFWSFADWTLCTVHIFGGVFKLRVRYSVLI